MWPATYYAMKENDSLVGKVKEYSLAGFGALTMKVIYGLEVWEAPEVFNTLGGKVGKLYRDYFEK